MKNIWKHSRFHQFVRWGLGIHGVIHIAEFGANIYEAAWISAALSLLAGGLMLAGATIDMAHHHGDDQ